MKRLLKYMFRWQLSTLTLAPVMAIMAGCNPWLVAFVGNIVGSLIFYKVDKHIFKNQ